MENLPLYISLVFALTTAFTIFLFFKASRSSKLTLGLLVGWTVLQSFISFTGFYTITDTMPPRFILLIVPPLIAIALLFLTPAGKNYLDKLAPKFLTLLHLVRVPVECVLLWLFLHKTVPQVMTFEGRNVDILSGLTAPIIYYFAFVKRKIGSTGLLIWNFICLGFLINIVTIAVLSAPFSFQQLGFDQPNVAVLYFPFVWLPCCVVPLVLLSHLAAIRQLVVKKKETIKHKQTMAVIAGESV